MNLLLNLVSGTLKIVLRLTLFVLASVVVVLILSIGLSVALFAVLRALLTGRKPSGWATFMRFRQASQQFRQGRWRTAHSTATGRNGDTHDHGSQADIVDVDFKDISPSPHEPANPHHRTPRQLP